MPVVADDPSSLNLGDDGKYGAALHRPATPTAAAASDTHAWISPPSSISTLGFSLRPDMKADQDTSPGLPASQGHIHASSCNGAADLCLVAADSVSPPDQTAQGVLRTSASSLAAAKARYHSVQKGAGIGKYMNGRGVGRASKLAQLEVAAEHLGASSNHLLLTSPRLLRSPGRKKSPIRWFPRKKTESYLERKIRMLQEKEGNVASLDETLGAANLHLSRIEREKLAAQAAAAEAMNSKKGALVEASWCRVLKLAGIPCKSAILELQKAEKKAAAALVDAENKGVILYHGPAERESSSEAVTASLDTAFDVDKEVTAAIKVALRHIADRDCDTPFAKDSALDSVDMIVEAFSEAESQSDPELMKEDCVYEDVESPTKSARSCRQKEKFPKVENSLVNLMISRIRDLSLEYQTALAGIVATRGLSALLKEQSLEQELYEKPAESLDCRHPHNLGSPKRGSDLGSILVKHVSRLQREVQAAKEASRQPQAEGEKRTGGRLQKKVSHVESLDQILVKHVSKLEKEKLAAQGRRRPPEATGIASLPAETREQAEPSDEIVEEANSSHGGDRQKLLEVTNISHSSTSLCSNLVKNVSLLEKEKQAASRMQEFTMSDHIQTADDGKVQPESAGMKDEPSARIPANFGPQALTNGKSGTPIEENEIISSDSLPKGKHKSGSNDFPDLGSILVKHESRLEKEKRMAMALQGARRQTEKPKQSGYEESLGDILAKRPSRLEFEKANSLKSTEEFEDNENRCPLTGSGRDQIVKSANSVDALGQAAKAKSQKSREMEGSWGGPSMMHDTSSVSVKVSSNVPRRRTLQEKQVEDAWGGLTLGNALKPHVSKLEKEQSCRPASRFS